MYKISFGLDGISPKKFQTGDVVFLFVISSLFYFGKNYTIVIEILNLFIMSI